MDDFEIALKDADRIKETGVADSVSRADLANFIYRGMNIQRERENVALRELREAAEKANRDFRPETQRNLAIAIAKAKEMK